MQQAEDSLTGKLAAAPAAAKGKCWAALCAEQDVDRAVTGIWGGGDKEGTPPEQTRAPHRSPTTAFLVFQLPSPGAFTQP